MTTLLVVAKAPQPGLVKTRLTPPLTPEEAADLAAAALLDTLDAVRSAAAVLGGPTPVVAMAGDLGGAARSAELRRSLTGFRVTGQRGAGLGERLRAAHADAAALGPVVQIGMDTPQVTGDLLVGAASELERTEAVLGPATDGGWWLLGVRTASLAQVLSGVPMSTGSTGRLTAAALGAAGARVTLIGELRDVDHWADVRAVAAGVPDSRFAAAAASLAEPVVVR